jgi:hypothetical protein
VFELDETVVATITGATSNSASLTVTSAVATGTITDDDTPPTVSIAVTPGAMNEDDADVMTYTVNLSNASAFDTEVTYTLSGTATEGDDYATTTGTVTIAAGDASATFTVDPTADTVFELDETVVATITGATSNSETLTVTTAVAIGTITNDDTLPVSTGLSASGDMNEDDADTLQVEAGADTFKSIQLETGINDIMDFSVSEGDTLDFSGIAGITGTSANWSSAATENSVNYFQSGLDTIVQADTDGNTSTLELQVTLIGVNSSVLSQGDFIL